MVRIVRNWFSSRNILETQLKRCFYWHVKNSRTIICSLVNKKFIIVYKLIQAMSIELFDCQINRSQWNHNRIYMFPWLSSIGFDCLELFDLLRLNFDRISNSIHFFFLINSTMYLIWLSGAIDLIWTSDFLLDCVRCKRRQRSREIQRSKYFLENSKSIKQHLNSIWDQSKWIEVQSKLIEVL